MNSNLDYLKELVEKRTWHVELTKVAWQKYPVCEIFDDTPEQNYIGEVIVEHENFITHANLFARSLDMYKVLVKLLEWDKKYPPGQYAMDGFYEFNSILSEAKMAVNGVMCGRDCDKEKKI